MIAEKGIAKRTDVMNIIADMFPQEWAKVSPRLKHSGNATWSKFLKVKGYLYTERFSSATHVGLEKKYSYQPTDKFMTDFVKRGYASVGLVADGRNKKIITYWGLIEELIKTEDFYLAFFQWAGVIKNDEIKYNIFGNHEPMKPVRYITMEETPTLNVIKSQTW